MIDPQTVTQISENWGALAGGAGGVAAGQTVLLTILYKIFNPKQKHIKTDKLGPILDKLVILTADIKLDVRSTQLEIPLIKEKVNGTAVKIDDIATKLGGQTITLEAVHRRLDNLIKTA